MAPAAPYLTKATADTIYLTKEEARTTYQPIISGTDEQGQSVDLSDYLKKSEASVTYATVGHTHTVDQITDLTLSNYALSTHTHNIYVATDSITTSIGNNTASTLIPTVGAIISYINSLDGDNVGFGG